MRRTFCLVASVLITLSIKLIYLFVGLGRWRCFRAFGQLPLMNFSFHIIYFYLLLDLVVEEVECLNYAAFLHELLHLHRHLKYHKQMCYYYFCSYLSKYTRLIYSVDSLSIFLCRDSGMERTKRFIIDCCEHSSVFNS